MKVIHLVSTFAKRGAELFANSLAYEMNKFGWDVSVVAIANTNGDKISQHDGIGYIQVSKKKPSLARGFAFLKLALYLRSERPDFVIAHGIFPLISISFFRFLFPKARVIYRNMNLHLGSGQVNFRDALKKNALNTADLLVFPSEKQCHQVMESYNCDCSNTVILPRGVDHSFLLREKEKQSVFDELGLTRHEKLVVHVGAFEPVKNHLGLVSIIRKLREVDQSVRFVLIGEGALRSEIEAQLPDGVFSLGYRDDAERYVAAADTVVLVSHSEGFGAVLAEASAYGVPSVVYDVGGVGAVIKDGLNGSLVPYQDEDAFCNALLAIVNLSESHKALMSRQAKALFQEEFSMEVCARRYLDLMSELPS